jgi:7-carboxy-7-deazaguanine synthase
MFGNNPKRPPVKSDGTELFVQNIFKTLQAEGPFVGVPSVFVRLGGCNLACSFCDTEFESFTQKSVDNIISEIQKLSKNRLGKQSIFLVVITGGEPLRQSINLLCEKLITWGYKVQIETNGTLYQELPDEVEIVCSPKIVNGKYHAINPTLLPKISAFKYLISANHLGYDVVPMEKSHQGEIFVQAMDEYDEELNIKNKKLAVVLALEHGYRLSYQIHKELDIE